MKYNIKDILNPKRRKAFLRFILKSWLYDDLEKVELSQEDKELEISKLLWYTKPHIIKQLAIRLWNPDCQECVESTKCINCNCDTIANKLDLNTLCKYNDEPLLDEEEFKIKEKEIINIENKKVTINYVQSK